MPLVLEGLKANPESLVIEFSLLTPGGSPIRRVIVLASHLVVPFHLAGSGCLP